MKKTFVWLVLRLIGTFIVSIVLTIILLNTTPISILWLLVFLVLLLYSFFKTFKLANNHAVFMRLLKAEVAENRLEAFHLLIWPFAYIGVFTLVCAQLNGLNAGLFVTPIKDGMVLSATDWIVFSLDQTSRAIFLDVFETYKIHLSSIDYAQGFSIASFVLIFKTSLTFVFWKFISNFFVLWKPSIEEITKKK